jgi:ribosomal protein S18 acetylase RimI-like enzyme
MVQFKDLTIQQLKKIVRAYNLHTTIKGYSKMGKDELIRNLEKHIILSNKHLIQPDILSPDIDVSNIIDEPQRRKQEREQRARKRAEQRAKQRAKRQAQPRVRRQAQPRAPAETEEEAREYIKNILKTHSEEFKKANPGEQPSTYLEEMINYIGILDAEFVGFRKDILKEKYEEFTKLLKMAKKIEKRMGTQTNEEKKAIERYQKTPKENIEKYTIFDNKGEMNNDTVDLKIKVEDKIFEFKKVGIFNKPKDMDKHSGKGWRYQYGYSNRQSDILNKQVRDGKIYYPREGSLYTNEVLSLGHHIISSINDMPIHMAHINSNKDDMSKELYVSFVDVHPDFQGRGLAEKAFLLLWSYFHKYDLFKKYNINKFYLTYAASAPVVGTYIRMINAAGYHNPFTDELDFKNMTKAFKMLLHTNAYDIPFEFYKKDSSKYKALKRDEKEEMNKFIKLEELNKLYTRVEKGGKVEDAKEAFLLGYVISVMRGKPYVFDEEDLRKIIVKYEKIIKVSQTKDINGENYISPLELKIMKESIPILKEAREKLLNKQKPYYQRPHRRRT